MIEEFLGVLDKDNCHKLHGKLSDWFEESYGAYVLNMQYTISVAWIW